MPAATAAATAANNAALTMRDVHALHAVRAVQVSPEAASRAMPWRRSEEDRQARCALFFKSNLLIFPKKCYMKITDCSVQWKSMYFCPNIELAQLWLPAALFRSPP